MTTATATAAAEDVFFANVEKKFAPHKTFLLNV